jgi:hypothetical protein
VCRGIFDANTHFDDQKRASGEQTQQQRLLKKCARSKRLIDALETGV